MKSQITFNPRFTLEFTGRDLATILRALTRARGDADAHILLEESKAAREKRIQDYLDALQGAPEKKIN